MDGMCASLNTKAGAFPTPLLDLKRVQRITKEAFADGRVLWVYLPTKRLEQLVTSEAFSPPSDILEAHVTGSIGTSTQVDPSPDWGNDVGRVRHVQSERDTYTKKFVSNAIAHADEGEPSLKVGELLMQYHQAGVRRPVVRSIRIRRRGVETQWIAASHPKAQVRITADRELPAVQDLTGSTTTLDLHAASEFNLDEEVPEDIVNNAHNPEYVENVIWRAFAGVRGMPPLSIREQVSFHPAEIHSAHYLQTWIVDRRTQNRSDGRDNWTVRPS